jgi:hypothetical protein
MRVFAAVYQESDGLITGVRVLDSVVIDATRAGISAGMALFITVGALEEIDMRRQYVDLTGEDPVLADKVAVTFTADKTEVDADGIDEITLSDLPDCNATMVGNTVAITDGELKLKVDLAGNYKVVLSGVTFLDTVFEFTAV